MLGQGLQPESLLLRSLRQAAGLGAAFKRLCDQDPAASRQVFSPATGHPFEAPTRDFDDYSTQGSEGLVQDQSFVVHGLDAIHIICIRRS